MDNSVKNSCNMIATIHATAVPLYVPWFPNVANELPGKASVTFDIFVK